MRLQSQSIPRIYWVIVLSVAAWIPVLALGAALKGQLP